VNQYAQSAVLSKAFPQGTALETSLSAAVLGGGSIDFCDDQSRINEQGNE
jgi:hypothetical protein